MRSFLKENLKFFPENVSKEFLEIEVPDNYSISINEQGLPLILKDNKSIHNFEDPIGEASKLLDNFNRKPYLSVFLGAGAFYHLALFAANYKEFTGIMLIFEPDKYVWRLALEIFDLRGIFNNRILNFDFYLGKDFENIYLQLFRKFTGLENKGNFDARYCQTLQIIELPYTLIEYPEECNKFMDTLTLALEDSVIAPGNDLNDGQQGLENIVLNAKEIIETKGLKEEVDVYHNVPAVIVSAGPSLNKNINLLHEFKKKGLIFGLDATYKKLRSIGIDPDYTITTERIELTNKFFSGIKEDYPDTESVLISCPVVHPERYNLWNGRKLMMYRVFSHFECWLSPGGLDKGLIRTGSSVADSAISIAKFLGCNPIILIGQDLCFNEEGSSHTDGVTVGTFKSNEVSNTLEYIGNDDTMKKTTRTWLQFLKTIETVAYELKLESKKMINCTEGGLKIDYTEVQTFREVIDTLPDINIIKISTELDNDKGIIERATLLLLISEQIKEISKFIRELDYLIKYIEKHFNRLDTGNIDIDHLSNIERRLFLDLNKILGDRNFYKNALHITQGFLTRYTLGFYAALSEYIPIERKKFLSIAYISQACYLLYYELIRIREILENGKNRL